MDEVLADAQFRLHGQHGLPASIMETEQCATSAMAMCEHVLATHETLHVPDIEADPVWRTAAAYTRHGLRHYAGAPGFTPDGELRCVLWLAHHRPRRLDDQEIALLERLARHLALRFATPEARQVLVARSLALN